MSQSKLQVYTTEASPVLESFFNTLLGQESTFSFLQASETTIEQIKDLSATAFSIVGTPENAEPFVVTLDSSWIPVISNAMVGREMSPDEEGVFDLAGQIVSQGYNKLKEEMPGAEVLPEITPNAHPPGAWEPDEAFQSSYWKVGFELQIGDNLLAGSAFVAQEFVDMLPEKAPAASEATPAAQAAPQATQGDPVGIAAPQFPDFGQEGIESSSPGNFDLLAEVELNITVELGRRRIPLSDVLKLTSGSVIELEKLVGEPLEIFANGRLIAEGEAVVIEEQFGVRISNLATNRLKMKSFA